MTMSHLDQVLLLSVVLTNFVVLGTTRLSTCIRAVATKWALPQNSPAMTFQAQVSLTPS